MKRWLHKLSGALYAALAFCAAGCFGVTQNPSYFPHLVPFGDIVQTHAKPPGPSYFANFDPHAIRLEVRPLDAANQVRTQHVIIATVYDEKGAPRRARRIEWMLEGVGNIIEVDESGVFPGRGYKTSNKHAVSYTAYHEHLITRGNDNPNDDFVIRPGQTWCVISSAVEGDSHMTVYAPGIANWDKGRVVVNCRWVDAGWEFPAPAAVRAGAEHVFTTRVFRTTDRQPLVNYRVRYKIIDGPAAILSPSQTTEYTAVSDIAGNAQVAIRQVAPAFGVNRLSVEIIRPPDPTTPSGAAIVIAKGETTIEWLAPNVSLNHAGPAIAVLGEDVTYTTSIANNGRIESRSMTVTSPLPDGLQYVRSQPPAFNDGKQLVWTLGSLPPGQAHQVQAVYRTLRQGQVTHCAQLATEEGQKDEKCVTTQVSTASIRVTVAAPPTGVVGMPVTYQVSVTNPTSVPLQNVVLTATYDAGLEHESRAQTINLQVGAIGPQQARNETLVLTPKQVGKFRTQIVAAAGNLSDQAIHEITILQPQMSLSIDGPKSRYKDKQADFIVRVGNPSDVPMTNVAVRSKLPLELQFIGATNNGRFEGGEVIWNVGTLGPREQRELRFGANAIGFAEAALVSVTATADPGIRKDAQTALKIFGLPALDIVELVDRGDPAEVGKKVVYEFKVVNRGTLPAKDIDVRATIPPEMKLVDVKGPTQPQAQGQIVTFGRIANLDAGQSVSFLVEVEAVRAGDTRFRVEVNSPALTGGAVQREEPTRIFDPAQPPPPPAPPGN
ncbi:MAG: hypothetical protein L0Y72_30890 [Gemmataceae bacterium]|nr:hypothetical protein [Gemmataceae bacterium]